jgi:pyruvate kinase
MAAEAGVIKKNELSQTDVLNILLSLAENMKHQELIFRAVLNEVHPGFQSSARNLLHYLQLRSEEIRPLQQYLHDRGLSSLTSSESHTLYQLRQVLHWLQQDVDPGLPNDDESEPDYKAARKLRKRHLVDLLGKKRMKEVPHIMVTLSPELADDSDKIEQLLDAGMTVARINCAHDDEEVWLRMIRNIRLASKPCKIYMDLSGPRIRVGEVPFRHKENPPGLRLKEGDVVELSEQESDFRKAQYKRDGTLKSPPRIVIQPEGIMAMMRPGERIFFDDGKFEARILNVVRGRMLVEVTRISTRKPILRAGKGVNLPDSDLTISSLTSHDLLHLPFIAAHADLVGYSFVSSPSDVAALREKLAAFGPNSPGIILKIERAYAVENLPALLLEGMKDNKVGVMIARGDLAVEIGFERLSEIQQEILWICEAAHVPVIWATQVLENMNKTGFATRSEITDAAMGGMAECVMLNKGPYVVKTVQTLVNILTRFAEHVDKKRFTFRSLSIAKKFLQKG